MPEDPLAEARRALDRGEYGQVLRLLEPLQEERSPLTAAGAELRLLMATALMGQGRTDQAAACCRGLVRCQDPTLRAQAKALLMVLEAPELRRPSNWSLTLPDLAGTTPLEGVGGGVSRRSRRRPEPPPPPPVGPTRAPVGFALVVAVVLLLLASLLGGCMEVRTELRFEGPGRLQVSHQLRSSGGPPSPWQKRFVAALEGHEPQIPSPGPFRLSEGSGEQILATPVLPAGQALGALAGSLELAGQLSGVALAAPAVVWEERNWLVGVRQHLLLELDLQSLEVIPGLDLAVVLAPVRPAAVLQAAPSGLMPAPPGERGGRRQLVWPLQPGEINVLELRCWRWSGLGVGAAAVGLLLPLVLALQATRRRLGFGLPELPA
ncbi:MULTISPECIES: DUF3153 domain-containing protein [unclassified Cyanobium]|uniref:DUF3153 domain-containing protein n=1 Tax=unclassified Cyanobium TaxID=2627006 RepID=UPI0020CBB99D|nr:MULTISPECIES: DUF3153 domain-containing protein [unclassified Cyanobium]MCP9832895.1 DUF3153 domain-containing protein [Cyanobium sp. La Preciosa 7G6]MCP9935645.1 DUF3153 domain-containing protein [Cyanobium sp. Aljojuca 7A6]